MSMVWLSHIMEGMVPGVPLDLGKGALLPSGFGGKPAEDNKQACLEGGHQMERDVGEFKLNLGSFWLRL